MEHFIANFIHISTGTALQVVLLGFIGGVLSGFIGSGGAFFMTPGMMNLGVEGVIAVASNITHKFGKAMVGSHKHGEAGNVDKKLALFVLVTAVVGIQLAVLINSFLFKGGTGHGASKGAGANLYISLVFALILSLVAVSMLWDVLKGSKGEEGDAGPSRKIADALSKLNLPPMIYFKVADTKVSLWVLLPVGIATGYLAGTIGVGGFIGVPAMIYVFGVPTAVAAGTELYLAMFMGAYGALSYAFQGFVDLRLTMLMYLGSLVGIYLGVYGVKVVNERYIRLVTSLIILLCVISRAIAIPMYLRQLGLVDMDPGLDVYFNNTSKFFLFASGITGTLLILFNVIRAYRQRRKLQQSIRVVKTPSPVLSPDLK
ncbi:sulfite exporter TauE/SafE family protein [Desulfospira joergensenii]|uniref:sulfite exporter TauE/SafE family protein n=1 Tax=Desulfospira joergensenii TaxID=53329 RepID=UPI0003B7974D|nr:sulfite exporter TauE/SafE family protein [Desulfospira joergensenii]